MNEERILKWFDTLSKLLLPAVLAVGGALFTAHQSRLETRRQDAQREAENVRKDLERDTGYIKMLVSTSSTERKLGLDLIAVLTQEGRFSRDLVPVLTVYASGSPLDPLTQKAGNILSDAGNKNQAVRAEIQKAVASSPVQVYLQVAKEEQRSDAACLQAALAKEGFTTPSIQKVEPPTATKNTYVRFFSAPGALQASKVLSVMKNLGYSAAIQDFSAYTQSPLSSLEVWIGSNQNALPQACGSPPSQ